MNPFDPALFSASNPCVCCGGEPCVCALQIPYISTTAPFPDYATALAAVTDQFSSCVGFISFSSNWTVDSFTVDVSVANQVTVDAQVSGLGGTSSVQPNFSITLPADAVLVVDFTTSATTFEEALTNVVSLLECGTNTEIRSFVGTPGEITGTVTFTAIPAGTYTLRLNSRVLAATVITAHWVVSSALVVFNPGIAYWDDAGTTRQLEACPKTNIPSTFGEGDWYADQAAAQAAITDQTSNCIGYCTVFDSFTATDGGTLLTFAGDQGGAGLVCWGSISIQAVGTITATFSNSLGGFFAVYAADGVTLMGSFTGPGPHTTASLPPGKYYVNTNQDTDGSNPAGSVVITASVAFTVNRIQALYDVGLTCPAQLDCP